MAAIRCGHCRNYHESVAEVRACSQGSAPASYGDRKAASSPIGEPAAPPPAPVTEAGMYRTPDGTIYKVQLAVHGSGRLYAKRLELDQDEANGTRGSFEYAPGAIRELTADMRMSLEQAKEFGHIYGVCCKCGRTLTNEESIAAGIGPICAGKW